MALRDDSDDEDFFGQGFAQEGMVSVWLFVEAVRDVAPRTDTLQDLCGVGYYRLSDQESFYYDHRLVDVAAMLPEASYAATFSDAAIAAAQAKGITQAYGFIVQYEFAYDPAKVTRPIADNPVFIGAFAFSDD
ncbi:hypothetical protein [Burkholderia sp. Ac-20379]|uniref:hypothetical protein n=1 Tax=Burkholderia sp. Ac-20379 TaxID=2703900 RepID=UPI00197ED28F|nr:hypothetical protein [Burkholderia sp. Ac-20379]MBN3725677.1 hypothetical protein [Burkholderia sp. Ac-20379]